MRVNLTKKDLVNSVYMQLGFSKHITENLIDDFFQTIVEIFLVFDPLFTERIINFVSYSS